MFMVENYVMFTLLLLAYVCLSIFVCKYKHSIETDDVSLDCVVDPVVVANSACKANCSMFCFFQQT